ncbi:uncharacterized protein UMAG_02550 [Mycosarcoma maydis]|uniref:Uncharacterized protein n=1 Tax=Mycosarcoma maydis TaxID=5270 RepID=A0A0D1E3Y8_MYCMD|nr:uncharacterized protein UMAG_02550 [Ustilago maydis 521]KIS69200.1 hypothetical protein UMAG_02550 [Ustilago maydis 521]|eukprot:XP_011388957.1 hypothetical protein UMAG_02550 [Ustilago maydis 521]
MVKAPSNNSSWQRLYRALLRSSAASVRFSRPATRNTRRYLRDEFADALVAKSNNAVIPSSIRPVNGDNDGVTETSNVQTCQPTAGQVTELPNVTLRQAPPNAASVLQLLQRQTHNTLAFHLSASLLPSSVSEHRAMEAAQSSTSKETSASGHLRRLLGNTSSDPELSDRDQGGSISTHLIVGERCMAARQDRPTKAARLAHRVVANLSSLTYHHLSPHTQMQSRAHLKQNRVRKPRKLSSLARVLGKVEADMSLDSSQLSSQAGLSDLFGSESGGGVGGNDSTRETVLNALHMKLSFLMPSVKPARGPISSRLKEWDGQNADKFASEGNLRQMEWDLKTVEKLLADHDQESAKHTKKQLAISKQVQQLKAEAEQLRKHVKAAARALSQAATQRSLESIPMDHLANLVAEAQDSQEVLLGRSRWIKRKNGDFLPP